ncbi:enoyl-CoA hydratase/isomerase family protein [Sodalis sp. RH21]|uniref:enoyl-CoA hydratase/isomerase family protein n=1 Tax=unclassified Sodalis (in: enterobacteria) TaxID=2636512 RepID=UPI0039B364F2
MVLEENIGTVRLITLNHHNTHNAFNEALETAVRRALAAASQDDAVNAVVVYGGDNRSFSAGGDFNEVKNLNSDAAVEQWIDRVIALYQAVLNVDKPTVAAMDGYAIGMGFQFAMMFDRRVMAREACLAMPELKHGIGCSVGAAILRFTHGFSAMRDIIYQCDELDAQRCLDLRLVNQITDRKDLVSSALAQASQLAGYPVSAFSSTKRAVNAPFIMALNHSRDESKAVHKKAFAARDAQRHFKKVLGENY